MLFHHMFSHFLHLLSHSYMVTADTSLLKQYQSMYEMLLFVHLYLCLSLWLDLKISAKANPKKVSRCNIDHSCTVIYHPIGNWVGWCFCPTNFVIVYHDSVLSGHYYQVMFAPLGCVMWKHADYSNFRDYIWQEYNASLKKVGSLECCFSWTIILLLVSDQMHWSLTQSVAFELTS